MNRIKTVGTVFGFALIVLVTVQYGLISSNLNYTKTMQEVHRNSQKVNQLYVVFGLLLDIETSSRGFLLTGEDIFLNVQSEAQRKLPRELERLDNYLLPEEYNQLTELISKRIAYADSLNLKRMNKQVITFYDITVGNGMMDNIRMEVARLTARGENSINEQNGLVKSSSRGMMALMMAGALFSLVVVVGSAYFVYNELKERLKAQKELNVALATSEAVTENVGQGVVVGDVNGKVIFANQIALAVRKMTIDEMKSKSLEELFESAEIDPTYLKQLLRTDKTVVETIVTTSTGTKRTVKVNFSPLIVNGVLGGVVVAYVDITAEAESISELKTGKEVALSATKAKSDFLAKMSHEIRTPLNAILGVGEIMALTKLSDEQKKCMEIYQRSSLTLINLVNDILDLSKIEAGKIELNNIPFSLKNLVDTCTSIMDFRASQKGLLFKSRLMSNYDHMIGDEGRIRQIVINLLGNAIKFTEQGSIILSVTCIDRGTSQKELLISVKDTGRGIAQENQNKLFSNYSQENNKIASEFGGTGLGLSLSKELANLMGGDIIVKSELGKGSEFILNCFVDSAMGEFENEATPKGSVNKNLKILLVDDNPENRFIVKKFLDESEVIVSEANDGVEAVEAYTKNKYDIIFMDINMPNKDGIEATKDIRAMEKEKNLPHTIIIALSANALSKEYDRAMEVGCDDYLTKPIARGRLLAAVEKWQGVEVRRDDTVDEAIKAAIPGYLENRRKDIEKLKNAFDIKELKAIGKIAHNIAGTAESYGQNELGRVAFLLDQAVAELNWQDIEKHIVEMEKLAKG
ncbi:response regulator [Bacteriovorax sp. PP10]|uniref:histidine kinase n=1 Tax=Bacteriovorax antarcticus TaxID=3088717 RepID=A0ABU5VV50_9BACT|nr:response regulator [Bacteriovorax sp. PP10]MEA9356936.1 response regulator [Bacteriovorax sp. PP10]